MGNEEYEVTEEIHSCIQNTFMDTRFLIHRIYLLIIKK